MIFMQSVMFVCYFLVVTTLSAAYLPPLMSDQIQQDPPTQAQSPGMAVLTLCWNGRNFVDECQKHTALMRQLLYKLLYRLKTETRGSDGDLFLDEDDRQDASIPAKKRQEEKSGFYSNW